MEKHCPRCPQNLFGAYKWRSDAIYNGDKPGTNEKWLSPKSPKFIEVK